MRIIIKKSSIEFPNDLIKYSVFLSNILECCPNDNEFKLSNDMNITMFALENIIRFCEYQNLNKQLTEDSLSSMTFSEYPEFYKNICSHSNLASYRELLHAANILDIGFIRIILYKYLIYMMYMVNPRTLFGMNPLSEEKIKEMQNLTKWISTKTKKVVKKIQK